MTDKTLYYLHELSDYKVASGYPDVRGWEVKDVDGRTIGSVDNLLVHKAEQRVVYLDVEVNESIIEKGHETFDKPVGGGMHEFINKDGDNHLIIPIGLVVLDEDNKEVRSNDITHDTFARAQRMPKGNLIERQYEIHIQRLYIPNSDLSNGSADDTFYSRKEFRR